MKFLAGLVIAVSTGFQAAGETFEEGQHYDLLPIPVETRNPYAIEVVEVFSYACVHCFGFESPLQGWLTTLDEDVDFRRVPAVFNNPTWEIFAKVYFSAEALRVTDKVHLPLFESLHVHGVDLRQPPLLARLFREVGEVDARQFLNVYDSFSGLHPRTAGEGTGPHVPHHQRAHDDRGRPLPRGNLPRDRGDQGAGGGGLPG